MENKVLAPNPYGPVSAADVQAFEHEIGLTLPNDYKQYLIRFNGGDFERTCFWTQNNPDIYWVLGDLSSLNHGPNYRNLNKCWNLAENRDLKVFSDGLNNYIEIGDSHGSAILLEASSGAVFIYDPDHSHVDTVEEVTKLFEFIAPSFREFVSRMISIQEAECRFED